MQVDPSKMSSATDHGRSSERAKSRNNPNAECEGQNQRGVHGGKGITEWDFEPQAKAQVTLYSSRRADMGSSRMARLAGR
jgi:hypothetical protein